MISEQRALLIDCHDCHLVGVVNVPERPIQRGVMIVTASSQYRAGSHRQMTLLARTLASAGIPVLRFDPRGCGDSEGPVRGFDELGDDIASAMKEFFIQVPEMKESVILGLCDAATAAAFYGYTDTSVTGLVLMNPWVRPSASIPAAAAAAPRGELDFWMGVGATDAQFAARHAMRLRAGDTKQALPQRMLRSLECFDGQVLLVLSGNDRIAREFCGLLDTRMLQRCRRVDIEQANHTFSTSQWRDRVAQESANWIVSW
ncbi:hydrolase 1, exosortase A system-associated [Pseudoduganella sp. GCM10020061]|uniref:hydrolase 1, exosortase A system-associated n=1 Tax=Pseudoduganella sp. GCM10020061 TaxID=3317345 RepID=UPI003634945F